MGLLDDEINRVNKSMESVLGGQKSSKSKSNKRDTRRSFSRDQQAEIWDRQNGKCAGSYCKHSRLLRGATHFDHIIPWEKGGKTVVSNGQALCPTCHEKKSRRDRLKTIDKTRKTRRDNGGILGQPTIDFSKLGI